MAEVSKVYKCLGKKPKTMEMTKTGGSNQVSNDYNTNVIVVDSWDGMEGVSSMQSIREAQSSENLGPFIAVWKGAPRTLRHEQNATPST